MSLRDDLVEAGARAQVSDFDALSQGAQTFYSDVTEHVLDAVLDTLADTDDIPLYPSETGYRDVVYTTADGVTAAYLIAVLRGDTE